MSLFEDWLEAVQEGRTEDAERIATEIVAETGKALEPMVNALTEFREGITQIWEGLLPGLLAVWSAAKPVLDAWEAYCWQEYRRAGSPYGPDAADMWRWTDEKIATEREQQIAKMREERQIELEQFRDEFQNKRKLASKT